ALPWSCTSLSPSRTHSSHMGVLWLALPVHKIWSVCTLDIQTIFLISMYILLNLNNALFPFIVQDSILELSTFVHL
uniref:Uncharacterized protein n=1 Tax=Aegilops tauschii subsp. strangulata TaxID=200361 RepID=A0A453MYI2_AEGTS